MAKKSMILKQQAPAKFSTRKYNRCKLCGRPHAYLRDYGVCRVCFRTLAYKGEIPGVRKASWKNFFVILRWLGSAYTKYAVASPPRLTKKFKIFPPYFVGPARHTQSTPSLRLVWRKNPINKCLRALRALWQYRMAKGHW